MLHGCVFRDPWVERHSRNPLPIVRTYLALCAKSGSGCTPSPLFLSTIRTKVHPDRPHVVSRTLFYIGGVLVSGLLVPANDRMLVIEEQNHKTGRSSPFVIAFNRAGWAVVRPCFAFTYSALNSTPPPFFLWQLPDVVNAAILLSAWSAAASDIYISSRFLFFLARRGHAPNFLAHLFRYPRARAVHSTQSDSDSEADAGSDSDSDADSDIGASSSPLHSLAPYIH